MPEDPFDLSHVRTPEPEYQPDLLTSLGVFSKVSNWMSSVTIFGHKLGIFIKKMRLLIFKPCYISDD